MSTENALLTLLKEGVSVKESPMDSKRDLEDALRSSCNDFIEHASMILIGPILTVLEQYKSWSLTHEATGRRGSTSNVGSSSTSTVATSSSTTTASSSSTLSLPSNLQASIILDALNRTVDRFEPQHGEVLRQMSMYMENNTTQWILLKPVIRKVQRSLEEIRRSFLMNHNPDDKNNTNVDGDDLSSLSTTASMSNGWNNKMIQDATNLLIQIEDMIKKSVSVVGSGGTTEKF